LGYYQLVMNADAFVFFDDVAYINRGYINRNKLLFGAQEHQFTIPLSGASQNLLINEIAVASDFQKWRSKFLKSVSLNYKNAPHFEAVFPILDKCLQGNMISNIAAASIIEVFNYLGIQKDFHASSTLEYDRAGGANEKVISLVYGLGGVDYVNAIGGKDIYSQQSFAEASLRLRFIKAEFAKAEAVLGNITASLSMLHILFHCNKESVCEALKCYTIVDE